MGTPEDPAVEAWESLFRAQVGIMRRLAEEFPLNGLSFNSYDVLFTLSREPRRTARLRDLNRLVLLSQPSMSRLIEKLVGEGLVTKVIDPEDKRGAIIAMTDLGYRTYVPAARAHMETIRELLGSALSPAELHVLRGLTDRLRCPESAEACE
ncbi:MarR family winged helix-turn-helix transcriptional regulator [Mycetocola spongiae]|uniref:MarR family winged helix-turn-helix transcriptional regulator n=1 Tax=Mycetocola spongiae TaxID=2859226 RepID=UPI001CF305DC|nr:MarR family transcriptional regulator [Mycetocola spongiae]